MMQAANTRNSEMTERKSFRLKDRKCLSLFGFETITISQACYDTFAINSDFLAQTCDVHVDGAVQHIYFVAPDAVQYILAREYASFILQKQQ